MNDVRKRLRGTLVGLILMLMAAAVDAQTPTTPRPAVPLDAISAIVDALRSHDVVAVPDAHGSAQIHAFLLSLIRDPRFAQTVNDIVVEFGSARYQEVLDRFERGEEVPSDVLRQVWQNTTQATAAADSPMYEEFFRAVRAVNAALPAARRIRVLAGDPPIDWDVVQTPADYQKWIEIRDTFPAELIQREVIAKKRRALLLYGQMHFQRKNVLSNYDMSSPAAQTIVSLLEQGGTVKVFTIWGMDPTPQQPEASGWRVPSVALVRGTVLGAADFATAFTSPRLRFVLRDGKPERIPQEQWRVLPAEDQLDAILYLGTSPVANVGIGISRALCADTAYMTMRLRRIAVLGGRPAQAEADRLKQHCAVEMAKQPDPK